MNKVNYSSLKSMLGNFIGVENLPSRNGCGKAPNQFFVKYENGNIFQSYDSVIGAKINGTLYLNNLHDYSKTTSGYCTRWTGLTAQERRKGLKDGSIIFIQMEW